MSEGWDFQELEIKHLRVARWGEGAEFLPGKESVTYATLSEKHVEFMWTFHIHGDFCIFHIE